MKLDDIFNPRLIDIIDITDCGSLIRFIRIRHGDERLDRCAIRTVVIAALQLLNDNGALIVQILLRHIQAAHAIGFNPKRQRQLMRGHSVVISGVIAADISIGRAAHWFQQLIHRPARHMRRALEHEMLEQMREAAFAFGVVRRADAIPNIDRHSRRRCIAHQDDFQPVVQRILLQIQLLLVRQAEPSQRKERQQRDKKPCHGYRPLIPSCGGSRILPHFHYTRQVDHRSNRK